MNTETTKEDKALFQQKMEKAQHLATLMVKAMEPECESPAVGALAALILAAGATAAAGIPAHIALATFVGLFNDSQEHMEDMPSVEIH